MLFVHAVEVGGQLVRVAPRRDLVVREQQPRVHEQAEVRSARHIVGSVHTSVCALLPRGGDVCSEMAARGEPSKADARGIQAPLSGAAADESQSALGVL